jgi:hypothetical protein
MVLMMRKEGFGRLELLPTSRYYLSISVRGMRKGTDRFSQDSLYE